MTVAAVIVACDVCACNEADDDERFTQTKVWLKPVALQQDLGKHTAIYPNISAANLR